MKQKLKSPVFIVRFDNHLISFISNGDNQYHYLNHVWLKMRNFYNL